MKARSYPNRVPQLLITAACLGASIGCGNGNPVAQIAGRVNLKDSSLRNAAIRMVRLEPTSNSIATIRKGACGTINDDGSFELYTRRPGDGVYLGTYAVTFAIYRGAMDQQPLIPAKYISAKTTPYQIVIDGNRDDLFFELEPLAGAASGGRK